MDLVGRQRGRGGHAHRVRVPRAAVGQRVPAIRRAAARQVLVPDEVAQAAVGRHDLVPDRLDVLRSQAPARVLVERGREAPDRLVEQARLRGVHDVRLELRQQPQHEHVRLGDGLGRARPHVGDRRVHPGHEAVDAAEEVLVVLRGLERMVAPAGAHDGKAAGPALAHVVDRDEMPGEAKAGDAGVEPEREDVVRHVLGVAQRRRLDALQVLAVAGADGLHPVPVVLPDVVGQHAIVLSQAGLAGRERVVGRDVAVVAADQLGQRRRRRRWGRGRSRAGVRAEQDRHDGGERTPVHRQSTSFGGVD